MFERALIMYIYAETPIHPGSGTTISGAVDLPIQRERYTGFPIIQGSSLKGVLRNSACFVKIADECEKCDKKPETAEKCEILRQVFGSPEGIGGISVTDARVLAFPVRTLKGVFGWVTCPLVLNRYGRDLKITDQDVNWNIKDLDIDDDKAIISKESSLKMEIEEAGQKKEYVYIEEIQLEAIRKDELIKTITSKIVEGLPDDDIYEAIRDKLSKDLVIVSDDVFRDLVTLTTEVVTRIKIDPKTGTVEPGGLWSEEYLPTDTLMYSLILIPSRLNKLKSEEIEGKIMNYDGKILQIGRDETIGKGFVRIRLVKGGDKSVKKP